MADARGRSLVFIYGVTLAAIALFAVVPFLGALASITVADIAGCRLDEGGTYPCLVFGHDIGESLGFFFVAGWFTFVTLPLGASAFCLWALVLVAHLIVRRAKRPA